MQEHVSKPRRYLHGGGCLFCFVLSTKKENARLCRRDLPEYFSVGGLNWVGRCGCWRPRISEGVPACARQGLSCCSPPLCVKLMMRFRTMYASTNQRLPVVEMLLLRLSEQLLLKRIAANTVRAFRTTPHPLYCTDFSKRDNVCSSTAILDGAKVCGVCRTRHHGNLSPYFLFCFAREARFFHLAGHKSRRSAPITTVFYCEHNKKDTFT